MIEIFEASMLLTKDSNYWSTLDKAWVKIWKLLPTGSFALMLHQDFMINAQDYVTYAFKVRGNDRFEFFI